MNKPVVIGASNCPDTHRLCDWLTRQGEDFLYSSLEQLPKPNGVQSTPMLITNGKSIQGCGVEAAAELLGYGRKPTKGSYELVVVGGGPAGLSCVIHAAAEGLSVLLLERYAFGGQMSSSQLIENYAGFPEGVVGCELAQAMAAQAYTLGAELIPAKGVDGILPSANPGLQMVMLAPSGFIYAKHVVLALGGDYRPIPACHESEFLGVDIHYGMTPRDALEAGKYAAVVGSGNSAGQAAIALAKGDREVALIVRRSDLSHDMSSYLVNEVSWHKNISIHYGAEIVETKGSAGRLNAVVLSLGESGSIELPCTDLFVFAGNKPEAEWLPKDLRRSETGHLLTDHEGRTNLTNVWAIGDVREGSMSRVAIAAAEGASVAALVVRELAATT